MTAEIICFNDSTHRTPLDNIAAYIAGMLPRQRWSGFDECWVAIEIDGTVATFVTTKADFSTGDDLPGDDFGGLLLLYRKRDRDQVEFFRVAFSVTAAPDFDVSIKALRQADGRMWSAIREVSPWFDKALSDIEHSEMTAEMFALPVGEMNRIVHEENILRNDLR
jgi:hypothetical protein